MLRGYPQANKRPPVPLAHAMPFLSVLTHKVPVPKAGARSRMAVGKTGPCRARMERPRWNWLRLRGSHRGPVETGRGKVRCYSRTSDVGNIVRRFSWRPEPGSGPNVSRQGLSRQRRWFLGFPVFVPGLNCEPLVDSRLSAAAVSPPARSADSSQTRAATRRRCRPTPVRVATPGSEARLDRCHRSGDRRLPSGATRTLRA